VPPGVHLVLMAAVSVQVFSESCDLSSPPVWRWRGPAKARRFVIAQSRLRLQAIFS